MAKNQQRFREKPVRRKGKRDSDRMLQDAGWIQVRNSKHRVYRCPCGEHQVSVAHSGGEAMLGALQSVVRRCARGDA